VIFTFSAVQSGGGLLVTDRFHRMMEEESPDSIEREIQLLKLEKHC